MLLVSAVITSFLNLIFHGASTIVHLLLLKMSMVKYKLPRPQPQWLLVECDPYSIATELQQNSPSS